MPSRATFTLVILLIVVFAVPAAADTIAGGQIFVSGFTLDTSLKAPGYVLTGIFDEDFFDGSPHLPNLCSQCSVLDIESIVRRGMIQFNPGGFIVVNGEPMGYNGRSIFTAATFHSSLNNGTLTVFGTAFASGNFLICTPTDDDCVDTGLVFSFSDKPWHYVAHFILVDPQTGGFEFKDVKITSVPEPATMFLFATGLGAAGFFRRKLGRVVFQ